MTTFDEWYDDPATLSDESTNDLKDAERIARAAYEAGARSRDEEVARFRKFYGDEVCVDCGERYSTKPRIKECRIAHLKA